MLRWGCNAVVNLEFRQSEIDFWTINWPFFFFDFWFTINIFSSSSFNFKFRYTPGMHISLYTAHFRDCLRPLDEALLLSACTCHQVPHIGGGIVACRKLKNFENQRSEVSLKLRKKQRATSSAIVAWGAYICTCMHNAPIRDIFTYNAVNFLQTMATKRTALANAARTTFNDEELVS